MSGKSASARLEDARDAIRYHDELAHEWNRRYERGGFARRAKFFRSRVLPQVRTEGASWLDVGCGSGFFSRILADGGATVLGIDGSAAMITEAEGLSESGNVIVFRQVPTVETLPFPDGSFDGCLCLSVLEYLPEPERCFSEMARVIRPGGYMVASVANSRSFLRQVQSVRRKVFKIVGLAGGSDYLASSVRTWNRDALLQLVKEHGLQLEMLLGFDPVLPGALVGNALPSLYFLICRKPA